MITGKLMFDVEIVVDNESELASLSSRIEKAVKAVDTNQVLSCEEVDSDVTDDAEGE